MTTTNAPALLHIIRRTKNEIGPSLLVLLGWLMRSDGEEAQEELELLTAIMDSTQLSYIKHDVMRIVQADDLDSVQLACEIIRSGLDREGRARLIELFIGMLLADGYISSPELFAIAFIADLLGISPAGLNKWFEKIMGRPMPTFADPGSMAWWEMKEGQNKNHEEHSYKKNAREDRSPSSSQRLKALAILGLEEGATPNEIKQAYRRLAQIHHPDRFQKLGPEAIAVAHKTFIRINSAYETLVNQ